MDRLPAIAGSVVLHLLLGGLLFFTVWEKEPPPQVATHKPLIQARAVDEATALEPVRRREAEQRRQRDEAERKRQAAEAQKQRQAEEKRQQVEAEKKRQAEAERQRQAALKQKKLEEEKRRKAEEQRKKAEVEKSRLAEEQRKKAEVEKSRLTEEQRKKEEAERQRREQEERERREAELQRQMAAEAERLAAEERARHSRQLATERARYIAAIQGAVQRQWQRPPGSSSSFQCKVLVKQIPSGDVIDVRVIASSGSVLIDRSVVSAVYKAAPLPLPKNWDESYRELEITFVPE